MLFTKFKTILLMSTMTAATMTILMTTMIITSSVALGNEHNSSIAFIDLDRIAMSSQAGKDSLEDLTEFDTAKKEVIAEAEADLLKSQKKIQENAKLWSQVKQEEAVQGLYQAQAAYQQLLASAQQEITILRNQALSTLYSDVSELAEEYAKENGYDILLNSAPPTVIYYDATHDITDEILEIYNVFYADKRK